VPVDENRRDEFLETFQTRHHPGTLGEDDLDIVDEEFEEEQSDYESE
jgi:hypothetical protein